MVFDSPIYLLALTIVVLVYWRLNHDRQNAFLLAFSYFFCGWWDWRFLSLIAISTLVDYYCARAVAGSSSPARRRLALGLSVGLNLAFLGFFKYFNFFVDSLHAGLLALGIASERHVLEILLPPGISFYTFQAIAYMVDVYRGRIPVAKSLRDYALFISLFPHLIAGPIQRPDHLLPQVQAHRRFDSQAFSNGILLVLIGTVPQVRHRRQLRIARQCRVRRHPRPPEHRGRGHRHLGLRLANLRRLQRLQQHREWLRATARVPFHGQLPRTLPRDLAAGFLAAMAHQPEFLAARLPLLLARREPAGPGKDLPQPHGHDAAGRALARRQLDLRHLGGLHGAWLAVERALFGERGPPNESHSVVRRWGRRIVIFHIVCLSWVFFRAASLEAALAFLGGLGHWNWRPEYASALVLLFLPACSLMLVDLQEERRGEEVLTEKGSRVSQAAFAAALLVLTLLFSASQASAFIYFQF